MARLSGVASPPSDPTLTNLTRLLSRLEGNILTPSPDQDARLRKSTFERNRVGANVEYARTLLLRLEHESSTVKAQSKKQQVQTDLSQKRQLIKRLNERLYELGQLDDDSGSEDDDDEETVADGNGSPKDTPLTGISRAPSSPGGGNADDLPSPSSSHPHHETETTSTLRSRRPPTSPQADTGMTTSSQTDPSLHTTESLLSHNRTEQEDLTSSLLNMAQALRASSQAFSSSLESEKEILDRAGEGLDQNASGMEAAEKRMGMLRRMTEGKGWLGRMLLYAWIAGLMMIALIIVGVLPKLRF
ncbi:MAG: hypothetical protein M1833_003851 [Piccolia ochrophora]|nr:MAG: hypothetical protein M1833_003851 [Piccolia ochrophora]